MKNKACVSVCACTRACNLFLLQLLTLLLLKQIIIASLALKELFVILQIAATPYPTHFYQHVTTAICTVLCNSFL